MKPKRYSLPRITAKQRECLENIHRIHFEIKTQWRRSYGSKRSTKGEYPCFVINNEIIPSYRVHTLRQKGLIKYSKIKVGSTPRFVLTPAGAQLANLVVI